MGSFAADQVERRLYAAIAKKAHELKCEVLALGGVADHVHLLVRFPTTLSVADLLKGVKGSSSHLMTHEIAPNKFFKWAGTYGAFTVSKSGVATVSNYILNQKAHHANGKLIGEWERCEIEDSAE